MNSYYHNRLSNNSHHFKRSILLSQDVLTIDYICSQCKAAFRYFPEDGKENLTSAMKSYGIKKECKGKRI